jgi:glucose/arabinose dehydrogenase
MTTAWKWEWDPATRKLGEQTVIITGMNNGGHNTRAVYISPNHPNIILASVGSNANWDYEAESMTAGRAAVKAFDMDKMPAGGFVYNTDGYQFGYGLRNEVGLVFDPANNVWGVENGGDVSCPPIPSFQPELTRRPSGLQAHGRKPGYGHPQ